MDKGIQNEISWLILTAVVAVFIVGLYMYANSNQQVVQLSTIASTPTITEVPTEAPPVVTTTPDRELLKKLNTIYGTDNSYNVIGTSSPKITIVEFGDFTCIHCRASYPVIRILALKYQDKIQFIYRDRTPSTKSVGLALAAHCAGEQGKFWPMHDGLFQNQSEALGKDEASIIKLADNLNIEPVQFKNCLTTKKYLNTIKKNMVDSERLAVEGTPTWYVNGIKYQSGEIDKTAFEDYLLELLAKY